MPPQEFEGIPTALYQQAYAVGFAAGSEGGGGGGADLWTAEAPFMVHYYAQVYEHATNANFFLAETPTATAF